MFVQTIPCDSLNLLLSNLVWWCITVSQIVFRKDWFAVFKVKVTVKAHIIKIYLLNCWSFRSFVWWHITISLIVLWKVRISLVWSRSRSQERFKIPVNVHLNDIKCWTFCNHTWYGDASSWARVSCTRVDRFAVWKFGVTVRVHIVEYNCFFHIYWTADLFEARFRRMGTSS